MTKTKTKKSPAKLTLAKETLRTLGSEALGGVAGGGSTQRYCTHRCTISVVDE